MRYFRQYSTPIALIMVALAACSTPTPVRVPTITSDGRWCIISVNGSTGNAIYNNILINHHSFRGSMAVDAASSTGFISDYNILVNRLSDDDGNSNMTLSQWQSMGYDLHSMIADPENQIFVDHTNNNYHLLQNAQAVDSGTTLVLPTVFEDLDNVPRPQGSGFDIGCYEYNTITSVEHNDLPSDFILFQNYPNPFNPSTKISWQSTVGSWQTIPGLLHAARLGAQEGILE